MRKKLSICIPTYNRASFIGKTLESIISQVTDEVEIVVSDNASNDNTEEIILNYQRQFPHITYFRWDENMGADRNYLKAVDLARGEYCWLIGSDDAIKHGAIKRVLQEIESRYDIYLCNRTECDFKLKPIKDRAWLSEEITDHVFNLSSNKEFVEYLNLSTSIGALFSYLSSIIFYREKWNKIEYDEAFTGSAYSHVFMLLSFINKGCRLKYIKDPLVYCRGDNDSFLEQGAIRRFLIDIEGYKLFAEKFCTNKTVKKAFLKVMTREHSWGTVRRIRTLIQKIEEWKSIELKLKAFGYSPCLLIIYRYFKFIIPVGRFIKSKTRLFFER